MICVSNANARGPFSTSELFWVSPPRDASGLYNRDCFFFASPDGSRLVPAMKDEPRFIAALTDVIESLAGFDCVVGLQQILDAITASDVVAVPIYPNVGDVSVFGFANVFCGGRFKDFQSATAPAWWWPNSTNRVAAQAAWSERYPLWIGYLNVTIANGNSYSTPPADLVEASDASIGVWHLPFKSSTEIRSGKVRFDIVQIPGEGCPRAINVVNV